MEIKTKYKPEDTVYLMHENAITTGVVEEVMSKSKVMKTLSTEGDKKELATIVGYSVRVKMPSKHLSSTGFVSQYSSVNNERIFELGEDTIYSSREELIASL